MTTQKAKANRRRQLSKRQQKSKPKQTKVSPSSSLSVFPSGSKLLLKSPFLIVKLVKKHPPPSFRVTKPLPLFSLSSHVLFHERPKQWWWWWWWVLSRLISSRLRLLLPLLLHPSSRSGEDAGHDRVLGELALLPPSRGPMPEPVPRGNKCCNQPRPDCCRVPCCPPPYPKCPVGIYVERVAPIRPDRTYEPPTFPFEGLSSYREQFFPKCGPKTLSFKPLATFDPSDAKLDGMSTYRHAYTPKPLLPYQKPPDYSSSDPRRTNVTTFIPVQQDLI